jgi:hypothetical protein
LVRAKPLRLIFDAETDGLLRQVTVCHCLVIKDADTGQVWRFRKNKREDTIAKGLAMLDSADMIFGHNIVGYDIPMFEKLFDWTPTAIIRDTLVLARLLFPDQKDKDFRLHEQGKLEGKLIGSHNLDSWGQRVGMWKGDYKKKKEAEGIALGILADSEEMRAFVWGQWTEELEDYCANDVEVTSLLMQMAAIRESSDDAIWVQHMLTDLMCRQQESGFFFDSESALELSSELKIARCKLEEKLDVEFPGRWLPAKRIDQCPFPELYTDEEIDGTRWFGVSQIRTTDSPKYKDPLKARWSKGSVYTPIKWQEFNPRSRPQITDRLQEMGWEPEDEDYTEKGNVKANDVILRRISEIYPVAETLADLMAVNKLMGQLADGKNSWLNMVDDDGFIRAYVNPCGAVTTRATHSFPNLAQIPAIKTKKVLPRDIEWEGDKAFITTARASGSRSLPRLPSRTLIRMRRLPSSSSAWRADGALKAAACSVSPRAGRWSVPISRASSFVVWRTGWRSMTAAHTARCCSKATSTPRTKLQPDWIAATRPRPSSTPSSTALVMRRSGRSSRRCRLLTPSARWVRNSRAAS